MKVIQETRRVHQFEYIHLLLHQGPSWS